ncbi:site-specific DNA-methyltransferase [candidate division WOR-3 bacterium]|nr:site-specific DNA-methyltransferase [candidate division WOR-3 bacterium]
MSDYQILQGDCIEKLNESRTYFMCGIQLTFLDPPFNQGKEYRYFNDTQPKETYWNWLKEVLSKVYEVTVDGGAIYFMQREKNAEQVIRILRETGWIFQNLIIWKKKTSAVPNGFRFSKQHQIIVFSTKGRKPRVFNKLRIDLPIPAEYKYKRVNGVYLTDVWDDIRELTSGYFAGNEPIRDINGSRVHKQQSPVALLMRIILSSTLPGDTVLDPFAGTGTTLVVAHQLLRNSIGIEIDPDYVKIIEERLKYPRPSDNISQYYNYYRYTENLKEVWHAENLAIIEQRRLF